jgi:hypothetical protein
MTTTAEQLAEVQAAISATLTSQQYTSRGFSQQRAALRDLHMREEALLQRLQAESHGGQMASVGQIDSPS